jgi:hypothetical protein
MNNWISVDERLPEENVVVLWYKERDGSMYSESIDRRRQSFPHLVYATHWMPLPEPPKEKALEQSNG